MGLRLVPVVPVSVHVMPPGAEPGHPHRATIHDEAERIILVVIAELIFIVTTVHQRIAVMPIDVDVHVRP